ncbi:MAG: hypothetical protein HYZ93_02465 [Candidatus Omnitrophica bacterium]|nr:hypothetical protein [Candidatus Omnitrophota bacterium]
MASLFSPLISRLWVRFKVRAVWSREIVQYTFPNLARPSVPLSEEARGWLAAFRRDGILKVEEDRFREIAEYLDQAYFKPLEEGREASAVQMPSQGLFILDNNLPKYREGGTEINANISFKDPRLAPIFFHPDLNGVLYNYYRRQPFYRNQPLLQKIVYDGKVPPLSNSSWHVDYVHQVSVMFLVSDVTERDTHMQYALGSHRKLRLVANYPEEIVEREGYPVLDAVGGKGTLFMFDAGGLHRACYRPNTSRKILHLNMTSGHHITPRRYDRLGSWGELAGCPPHSRRMMEKIGC